MTLRNRINDHSFVLRAGMLCLILASALYWFLDPVTGLGRDLGDGVMGILFGLSFGLNLRAAWLAGRRRTGG